MRLPGKRRHLGRRPATLEAVAVTIRLAGEADRDEIERLAGRDSAPVPAAPLLVAERDGGIEAALSPRTGAAIADPFRHTAELVELLRCHADGATLGDGPPARPASRRSAATGQPRLAAGCP